MMAASDASQGRRLDETLHCANRNQLAEVVRILRIYFSRYMYVHIYLVPLYLWLCRRCARQGRGV